MSTRRVLLSGFACAVLARVAGVYAADPSDQPILGPAEPIGKLLVVTAAFDESTDAPPPVLFPLFPVPGPELIPSSPRAPFHFGVIERGAHSVTSAAPQPQPHAIELHLSSAIHHLFAAGLTDESRQVDTVLRQFQTKHRQRVLLVEKQAQLAVLEAEIERLKFRVEKGILADQISISIKIFETSETAVLKLLKESLERPETEQTANTVTRPKALSKQDIETLIELLQDTNGVRILSSPQLIVLSGRTGEVHIGGQFTIPLLVPAGGSEERSFGTFVKASPTITDKDQIRLALTVDTSELDMANAVTINNATIPGLSRRRIQSTLELKDGQTVVLGGLISTRNDKTWETFITVTTEIVQPVDQNIDPIAPQPIPAPLLK